jgi:2-methylcitrate dehydratase
MWKGCAAANAARNGGFAAIMAAEGMAGPPTPFEDGLTAVIGAEEICPFPVDPTSFSMLKADYKFFLSEFHAQGPAFLALELLPQIKLDDIAAIEVSTYHFAWFEIGSGAEKWQPTTRETADHSMPYVIAAVLIDGAYTDAIFESELISGSADARPDEEDHHHRGCRVQQALSGESAAPDDDQLEEQACW